MRGITQNDGTGGIAQVAAATADDDAAGTESALADRCTAGVGVATAEGEGSCTALVSEPVLEITLEIEVSPAPPTVSAPPSLMPPVATVRV